MHVSPNELPYSAVRQTCVGQRLELRLLLSDTDPTLVSEPFSIDSFHSVAPKLHSKKKNQTLTTQFPLSFVHMVTHTDAPGAAHTRLDFRATLSVLTSLPRNNQTSQSWSCCVCKWTLSLSITPEFCVYEGWILCLCISVICIILATHVELICTEHKLYVKPINIWEEN